MKTLNLHRQVQAAFLLGFVLGLCVGIIITLQYFEQNNTAPTVSEPPFNHGTYDPLYDH